MSARLRRRHTPDLSPTTAQLPFGVSLRCIELQKHRDLALQVPSGKTIRAAEYEWACGRLFSHYNYGFRTGRCFAMVLVALLMAWGPAVGHEVDPAVMAMFREWSIAPPSPSGVF